MIKHVSDWHQVLKDLGAFCSHDGNPRRPHSLLTSGKHSGGYVDCSKVAERPDLLHLASEYLIARMREVSSSLTRRIERVVGPAQGAITLASAMAFGLSQLHDDQPCCKSGFTEKDEAYGAGVMEVKRFRITEGEVVLAVEDVFNTGGSTEKNLQGITRANGVPVNVICCLVNRSGLYSWNGRQILSLLQMDLPIWPADECPLCKGGSTAIRPKDKGNWELLTQAYPS